MAVCSRRVAKGWRTGAARRTWPTGWPGLKNRAKNRAKYSQRTSLAPWGFRQERAMLVRGLANNGGSWGLVLRWGARGGRWLRRPPEDGRCGRSGRWPGERAVLGRPCLGESARSPQNMARMRVCRDRGEVDIIGPSEGLVASSILAGRTSQSWLDLPKHTSSALVISASPRTTVALGTALPRTSNRSRFICFRFSVPVHPFQAPPLDRFTASALRLDWPPPSPHGASQPPWHSHALTTYRRWYAPSPPTPLLRARLSSHLCERS